MKKRLGKKREGKERFEKIKGEERVWRLEGREQRKEGQVEK